MVGVMVATFEFRQFITQRQTEGAPLCILTSSVQLVAELKLDKSPGPGIL